jgi:hypothetical protein
MILISAKVFEGKRTCDDIKKHTEVITFSRGGSTELHPSNCAKSSSLGIPGFGLTIPSEFGGEIAVEADRILRFRSGVLSTGNKEFSEGDLSGCRYRGVRLRSQRQDRM